MPLPTNPRSRSMTFAMARTVSGDGGEKRSKREKKASSHFFTSSSAVAAVCLSRCYFYFFPLKKLFFFFFFFSKTITKQTDPALAGPLLLTSPRSLEACLEQGIVSLVFVGSLREERANEKSRKARERANERGKKGK